MSLHTHRDNAPEFVRCAIITVSDTRTPETDKTGLYLHEILSENKFEITGYRIVKDEYEQIQQAIKETVQNGQAEAILLNGGTGIAFRDCTYEAVKEMLYKELPGFGEIFRYLSYTEDIGSAAILSRAVAGVYEHTAVFSMPGSVKAVRLAMEKIVIPELGHVVYEIKKDL